MKKYNFNAGPSMLPREVIENTAKQCLDFQDSGLSLMEISHRAKNFQPVVDEAEALVKERYCYVAVLADKASRVLANTAGEKIKGVKTVVEIVK